jgi:methylmalonyl-CoA/ethylmalonyl-CoA epimerase
MTRINHVAVVVADLDEALRFWRDALGLPLSGKETVAAEAVDVAFLPVGESKIELLQPTDDASGVARYLARRGPGLHHLCLEVDDIDGMLARLQAHAVELINPTALSREDGTRYAFVHPRATGGVLVELYETP